MPEDLPRPPPDRTGWPWTPTGGRRSARAGNLPRISVVTPSYNQAGFIEQTIRSVLLQGYPDLEYIIVDGGSTDGTLDVIRRYEPHLAWWCSEPDRGQSHAVNKGWGRATGDVLAWINSDDYYEPGALDLVAARFSEAGPELGLVHGRSRIVDEQGATIREYGRPFDVTRALLTSRSGIAQQTVFMRAAVVSRVGGLAEDLHMAMDYDLWNRVALTSSMEYIPSILANLRLWEGAKTVRHKTGFGPDHLRSLRRLYARDDLPDSVLAVKREALAAAAMQSANGLCRNRQYGEMWRCYVRGLASHPVAGIRRAGRHNFRYLAGPALPYLVRIKHTLLRLLNRH